MAKRCTRCGELKSEADFNRRKAGRGGLNTWCRSCWRAYQAEWRARNPDHAQKQAVRARREPKVAVAARARRWKRANAWWRRADRARRRGAAMCDEAKAYVVVLLGDPCSYCSREATTVDHIAALSVGGDSSVENLTAACRSCNASKSDEPLLLWLAERSR